MDFADAAGVCGGQMDLCLRRWAGSAESFVQCLQQALQLGVQVTGSSQQPDQLAAAGAFLADAARAGQLPDSNRRTERSPRQSP